LIIELRINHLKQVAEFVLQKDRQLVKLVVHQIDLLQLLELVITLIQLLQKALQIKKELKLLLQIIHHLQQC